MSFIKDKIAGEVPLNVCLLPDLREDERVCEYASYERALLLCKELTLREKVDQLGNNVSEPVVRNGL